MQPRDAGIVASRIIALYFGVQAVLQFISFLTFSAGVASQAGRFLIPVFALGGIAIFLWVKADAIGGAIARGSDPESPTSPHPLEHIRGVATFIVGLVLVGQAVPGILGTLISDVAGGPFFGAFGPFSDRSGALLASVGQLVLGIVFMAWGRSLTARPPDQAHGP